MSPAVAVDPPFRWQVEWLLVQGILLDGTNHEIDSEE